MIQLWEKFRDGRTDRRTDIQTKSDFIGYYPTNIERPKIKQFQKRIQNPVKHLRCSFCGKPVGMQLTIETLEQVVKYVQN